MTLISISKLKSYRYEILAISITIIYIVILSSFTIYRYEHLGSGYFDLGAFTQSIHNSSKGRLFEVTSFTKPTNITSLEGHFNPTLLLNLPFYIILPDARSLLISQSIFIGSSIYIAYLLSCLILKSKSQSIVAIIIYTLSFTMINVNIFDFHAIAIAIPLLMLTFYLIEAQKYRYIFLPIILLILTKENLPLTTAAIGMYILFIKKEKLVGASIVALSAISFLLIIGVITPYFSSSPNKEILPVYRTNVLPKIFNIDTVKYLMITLKPYIYIPLLGPLQLLIALPEIIVNSLGKSAMKSTIYHYTAILGPIYFFSFLHGYMRINKRLGSKYLKVTFNLCIVIIAFLVFIKYSFYPIAMDYLTFYTNGNDEQELLTLEEVEYWTLNLKDTDIPVSSSNRLGAHFGNRKNYYYFLYDWPTAYDPKLKRQHDLLEYGKTRYQNAEYVILDLRDISPYDSIAKETYLNLLNDDNYSLIDKGGYIVVYKRT